MSVRSSEARSRGRGRQRERAPQLMITGRPRRRLKRTNSRRVGVVIAAGVAVLAIVFAVLLEQVVLAQSAFRLAEIRSRVLEAEQRHEELSHQAALLASPARIERKARALGMIEPTGDQVKYIVADIPNRDGTRAADAKTHDAISVTTGAAAGEGIP